MANINAFEAIKKAIGQIRNYVDSEITTQNSNIATNRSDINEIEQTKADNIEAVNETETTKEIQPNVFYVWGEVASLDITLVEPTKAEIYNEYMFQFVSGEAATTLTLPDSVKWAEQPLIEPNSTYQVSIVNNIGLMIGVGNA